MTDLAVLATDARTGAILDELPVESFDWSPQIGQASQVSSVMTATAAQAKVIAEGDTVLHLTDGATILGGNAFLVNEVQWKDRQLTLTGDSLRNWIDRRNLRTAKTYTAQDQFAIVSDLLDYANGSSLGIGVSFRGTPGSTSGVNRTIAYAADRSPLGQLIDDLAALDSGFEWDITAEWSGHNAISRYLECWYPARGQVTDLVWEHGKNCQIDTYISNSATLASLVEFSGTSSTTSQTYGVASATTDYPRFDSLDSMKYTNETADTAVLNARAAAALARNEQPIETCTVTGLALGDLADTNVKVWGVGDQITLAADLKFRVLSGAWRITACSYKLAQGKFIADNVTLARSLPGDPILPPDGWHLIAKMAKKVKVLERR